jgi:hypothetical protein
VRAALLTVTMLLACGTRAGPEWLTGDCRADHEETIRRLDALAATHRSPCATSSDCLIVEAKVSCQAGGLVAVARSAQAAWEADQQAFQDGTCPYLSTACSLSTDGETPRAECVESACVAATGPTDGGP